MTMTIRELCYELLDQGLTADDIQRKHPSIRRKTIMQYRLDWIRNVPLHRDGRQSRFARNYRAEIYAAIERLEGDPMNVVMTDLARTCGVSYKTARRYFDEYFGLTPKDPVPEPEPEPEPEPVYVRPSVRMRCGSGAVFDWDTPTDTIWR